MSTLGWAVAAFAVFGVFVALSYRLRWEWTGLPFAVAAEEDGKDRPAKTLWDWLQLLGIPVALAALAFLVNESQARRDHERAMDADRESTLRAYLTQMSGLMLDRHLLRSKPGAVVRQVARIVTLTAVRRLDGDRRGLVFEFLLEGGVLSSKFPLTNIGTPTALLDVASADFEQIDLHGMVLGGLDLRGSDLSGADLTETLLIGANFNDADLSGADLTGADLTAQPIPNASPQNPKPPVISVKLLAANLTGANLTRAKLNGADLGGANLSQAKLSNAILRRASLLSANLRDADLRGADLRGAQLAVADVTGADLRGARGVDLTGTVGKPAHGP